MRSVVICLLALLAASPAAAAQLQFFNPYPKIDTNRWMLSDGWANGDYQACEWRADAISVHENNIRLTLSDRGGKLRPIGCGEMRYNLRTGYGTYEVRMRAASGSGLNSAFFTYIGPPVGVPSHDEIDFEFLGKDPRTVELNYYVNGKPQDGTKIPLGFDASEEFHTYTFLWEPLKIRWYIDGKLVHETKDGVPIPSNPGRIYVSLWAGASSKDDWLGHFTYTAPVSAEVAWVKYTPLR